jgi:hypothetical protein
MKRVENFRKGDRAEDLGVFLLRAFCAVAEVPRQEDFGLMDAVATLLRRESGCLYAEDSFLVQFKSRTERTIEYFGTRFEAVLNQDIPLLVAQVDLTRSSVQLHSLGIALAHCNIHDAKGLVAHLQPDTACGFGLEGDLFHVPFRKPILEWTVAQTEEREFTDHAYKVLKAWLSIERWNRRYRRAGIFRQIQWDTNGIPTEQGEAQMWQPTRSMEILGEMVPWVRLLTFQGFTHAELRAPTRTILSFLRKNGIEADPNGSLQLLLEDHDAQGLLKVAMDSNPEADVAVTFRIVEVRPEFLDFWLFGRNKEGTGSGRRHSGSPDELLAQGFETKIVVAGSEANVTLGLSDAWLREGHFEEATQANLANVSDPENGTTQVLLLRKAISQSS